MGKEKRRGTEKMKEQPSVLSLCASLATPPHASVPPVAFSLLFLTESRDGFSVK